jgi:hypothetical protein
MSDPVVDDIIKQIVLAHADDELQAIAVVLVNKEGEPEIKYGVDHLSSYAVNFGLDVIKAGLMSNVLNNASKPGKERE